MIINQCRGSWKGTWFLPSSKKAVQAASVIRERRLCFLARYSDSRHGIGVKKACVCVCARAHSWVWVGVHACACVCVCVGGVAVHAARVCVCMPMPVDVWVTHKKMHAFIIFCWQQPTKVIMSQSWDMHDILHGFVLKPTRSSLISRFIY